MSLLAKLASSKAPKGVVLIRLMVGAVFLTEGILKFLHPEELGAGRFARIGIPAPAVMGPFVAGVETICGALVLVGLLTRLAAIPLLINISVAIFSTKIPILLGHGFWTFTLAKLPRYGFLSMVHEARTDFSMLARSRLPAVRRRGEMVARRPAQSRKAETIERTRALRETKTRITPRTPRVPQARRPDKFRDWQHLCSIAGGGRI